MVATGPSSVNTYATYPILLGMSKAVVIWHLLKHLAHVPVNVTRVFARGTGSTLGSPPLLRLRATDHVLCYCTPVLSFTLLIRIHDLHSLRSCHGQRHVYCTLRHPSTLRNEQINFNSTGFERQIGRCSVRWFIYCNWGPTHLPLSLITPLASDISYDSAHWVQIQINSNMLQSDALAGLSHYPIRISHLAFCDLRPAVLIDRPYST